MILIHILALTLFVAGIATYWFGGFIGYLYSNEQLITWDKLNKTTKIGTLLTYAAYLAYMLMTTPYPALLPFSSAATGFILCMIILYDLLEGMKG